MLNKIVLLQILVLLTFSPIFGQSASSLYNDALEQLDLERNNKATNLFEQALEKAEESDNVELQMLCHIELAELKENLINYKEAIDHYQSFTALYKSITEKKTKDLEGDVDELIGEVIEQSIEIDSLTTEQLQSELDIQRLEVDKQKAALKAQREENRRNLLLLLLILLIIIVAFVVRAYLSKRKNNVVLTHKNDLIAFERKKSDELLRNILPDKVAAELKESGKTTPSKFKEATVLFTDFKGFTQFTELHTPEELVATLDFYFSAFDKIVAKHNIEKIKTIGDAYLCVSGIPEEDDNHVENMILAAIEMRQFVIDSVARKKEAQVPYLEVRIGIHMGTLVAGVVGSEKFAYDVWGDTVNVAARMEQSGAVSEINVSENVYERAKDTFNFEYRGAIQAKNKGKLAMYFVREKID